MSAMKLLKQQLGMLLHQKERVVVAIDGRCASGKTTLAQKLAEEFDCNVIHADDFFLRPEQRTKERLAEPGGNLDRERFLQEVILPLHVGRSFLYRPYDCGKGELGDPVFVPKKRLTVVEGSYSAHPCFGDVYDLRVFLDITPQKQKERLEKRNPEKLQMFLDRWIPMEEAYFDCFSVRERCDLILWGKEEDA